LNHAGRGENQQKPTFFLRDTMQKKSSSPIRFKMVREAINATGNKVRFNRSWGGRKAGGEKANHAKTGLGLSPYGTKPTEIFGKDYQKRASSSSF